MGSDLFRYRFDGISQNEMRLHIWIIHPDQTDIPDQSTFFLRSLLDCYKQLRDEMVEVNNGIIPTSKEMIKKYFSDSNNSEIESLLLKALPRTISITKEEYNEIQEKGSTSYKGEEIGYCSTGDNNGIPVYEVLLWPNPAEFRKVVWDYIDDYKIIDRKNFGKKKFVMDKKYEKVPQADIILTLKNENIFSYLPKGIEWQTVQFE